MLGSGEAIGRGAALRKSTGAGGKLMAAPEAEKGGTAAITAAVTVKEAARCGKVAANLLKGLCFMTKRGTGRRRT